MVLGGPSVVSDGVMAQLGAYTVGGVTRLAGPDRYATAAAVVEAAFPPGSPATIIATGENFPDALAAVPAAAALDGPVLLVTRATIPPATDAALRRLAPGRIIVVGSAAVVSDEVMAALETYTAGSVSRLAGPDRYATAVAVSAATFETAERVMIATGLDFADSLGGGAAAGASGSPLLLVPGTSLPANVRAELLDLRPDEIIVLGGPSVVSDGVLEELRGLYDS